MQAGTRYIGAAFTVHGCGYHGWQGGSPALQLPPLPQGCLLRRSLGRASSQPWCESCTTTAGVAMRRRADRAS
eukprot:scaffold808_cov370-Prasinococcus_capsulatus_cf.AAC.9